MSEFFDDFLRDFIKDHTMLAFLFACLFIGVVVLSVGVAAFGWNIAEMVDTVRRTFSSWLYAPLSRSFEDLQRYVGGW